MAKGILYVETHALPEELEAYHQWYDKVHLKDFLDHVPGVVSARRYTPLDDRHPFVTIYEIEADDLDAVRAGMATFGQSMAETVGVDHSKPRASRFYELRTTYPSS